jgi:EAL domain-containing protein (putative c-di-GMP-specific phosphodiesterase class I)
VKEYLLVMDLPEPGRWADRFGEGVIREIRKDIHAGFERVSMSLLDRHTIRSDVVSPVFGRWYVSFSPGRSDPWDQQKEQLESLRHAGIHLTRQMLQRKLGQATGSRVEFKMGVIPMGGGKRDRDSVGRYLDRTLGSVSTAGRPFDAVSRESFQKLLRARAFEVFLQPVVSLETWDVVGYEALTRGPRNTALRPAARLFGTASRLGLTEALEKTCMEIVLDLAWRIPDRYGIFVNIGPELLVNPGFLDMMRRWEVREALHRTVFEITEGLPLLEDDRLRKTVEELASRGVRFALDDTGCGFASLDAARILRPAIVKLCISVTRRVGRSDRIVQDIRDAVGIVEQWSGTVLAEGVERADQVDILRCCGVSLAQGYYFGRPFAIPGAPRARSGACRLENGSVNRDGPAPSP